MVRPMLETIMPSSFAGTTLLIIVLDLLDVLLGVLDARPRWRLHIDHELSGVGAREERHPHQRIESETEQRHSNQTQRRGRRTQQLRPSVWS